MIFSIIIPIKDTVTNLRLSIDAILKDQNLTKTNHEIIVANDGASSQISNYIESLKKNHIRIKEVQINKSSGAYYARNRAIEIAKGDILFFFDAPLRIADNWFITIQPYLHEYDYLAGEVRMIRKSNMTLGERLDYIKAFPTRKYFENEHYGVTAYLAVKRRVFESIGNFLEFHSGGDNEFGRRVFNAGFKQIYFDKAPVFHEPRTFYQQYLKLRRDIKGIYDLHRKFPDRYANPLTVKRLFFSQPLALVANLVRYRKNELYKSGLFTFNEYARTILIYRCILLRAHFYVLFNKNRTIST